MPKPLNTSLAQKLAAFEDRRMTYIAAFPCQGGYVCCADTLETVGDEKQYVEKLAAYGDGDYPFCIGGAGTGEIIDALTQEISERVLQSRPQGCVKLKDTIRSAVKDVYDNDVPVMVLKRQQRTAQLLIAVNSCPSDSVFCLFRVDGRRIFTVARGIIGYSTATNQALLKRFHDPEMPMSQAVVLAVYLVSQSKLTDEGVGGDTRIGVVSQFSAKIEDAEYVRSIEKLIVGYLPIADDLFRSLSDVEIPNDEFECRLQILNKMLRLQRRSAVLNSLEYVQFLVDQGKLNQTNWPYSKIPLGTTFRLSKDESGRMVVSEVGATPSDSQTSEDQP